MDLDNKTGALEDFYRIWKTAFQLARTLHSPGVVVDMEDYNDKIDSGFDLSSLAAQMRTGADALERKLESAGGRLVEIANQVYPGACVWLLFSGFGNPKIGQAYRTSTYFVIGMLKKSRGLHSKLQPGAARAFRHISLYVDLRFGRGAVQSIRSQNRARV